MRQGARIHADSRRSGEPEKYAQWVAEQKSKTAAAAVDVNKEFTADELKAEGEKVYAANCVACHQANGKGIPGTFAALAGSKIATVPRPSMSTL